MKTVAPWYSGYQCARGVSEIRDGQDLGQWSWLEISLNAFVCLTMPQKQFIIIFNNDMVFLLSGILIANG